MVADPWRPKGRRAFTMVEVAITVLLLTIAMTATVQVLGWVAVERRQAERRQYAVQEVANLMERLTALPWERVTPDAARALTLSEEVRRKLPEPELTVDVDGADAVPVQKRLAIRLRWRKKGGAWESPVHLTAWIARKGGGR